MGNRKLEKGNQVILSALDFLGNVSSKGLFHLVSANMLIGFFGFGSQLLVAKLLSPTELGQIKTVQAYISVASIIAGFGFNGAVLKLCSEKRGLDEKIEILRRCFYYSIIPVIIVVLIVILLAGLRVLSPDSAVNKWLIVYIFIVPSMVYVQLIMGYLQALKKIKAMSKAQILIRIASIAVVIIGTYFCGIFGFFMAGILMSYISLVPLMRTINLTSQVKKRKDVFFFKIMFYARWNVADNAISTFGKYLDIFVINHFILDRSALGYYGLATIFLFMLTGITSSIQSIALPYFSEKSNNKNEFIRVLSKYQVILIGMSFGLAILGSVIVPVFILKVYGQNYADAARYFQILSIKYFIWSCYALLGIAIMGLGKYKYNFVCTITSLPVSIVCNIVFLRYYGVFGVAAAQIVAAIFSLFVHWYAVKRSINEHFSSKYAK